MNKNKVSIKTIREERKQKEAGKVICVREINENIRRIFQNKPLTRPLALLNKNCMFKKRYNLAWNLRNEDKIKARIKEYTQIPEIKAKIKEYHKQYGKRPEVITRRRKYHKKYFQIPEVKARIKEYNRSPEVLAKRRKYFQSPKIKAKMKEYYQKRYLRNKLEKAK